MCKPDFRFSILAASLFLISILHSFFSFCQVTRFELSNGTETPTYAEGIRWWKQLDAKYPEISMKVMGPTDAGLPLHLIVIAKDRDFNFENQRKKGKFFLLINNAIHPGESDGVDASMLFAREMLEKKLVPDNVVICILPFYNIGGALNRNSTSRANQNGPKEYGFRGNSQNLDLNRDFIKCDTREAQSFAEIFHLADPDLFIDNHVSDGADYQHIITLLSTNYDKMGGETGKYLREKLNPDLFSLMKTKGYDLVPYVDFDEDKPEKGITAFYDLPRYSTGYAALWQCFGFMPEMHMLKPYDTRVQALKTLLQTFTEYLSSHGKEMRKAKLSDIESIKTKTSFTLSWEKDTARNEFITYRGFESGYKPSAVSGLPRLYYDRSKPFTKEIKFYNYFKPDLSAEKPVAYIIPQGWYSITDRLKKNNVQMEILKKDTSIEVEYYHIDDYRSAQRPYEKHHMNSAVKISKQTGKVFFRKGDHIVYLNQRANRFLMETLEPNAPDSYFTWNFFDAILGQKEGYSAYVYEEVAAEILKNNPGLKKKLEEKKANDEKFAKSAPAQLDFIYKNSDWYEKTHLRYPVYRLN